MFLIFNHKHDFFFQPGNLHQVKNFPLLKTAPHPWDAFSRRKAQPIFSQHRGLKIGGAGLQNREKSSGSVFLREKKEK